MCLATLDGNAGTRRTETPETRLCHSHPGMKQGAREQCADIQFGGTWRGVSVVQSKQVISPDPQTRRFRDSEQEDQLFRLCRRCVSDGNKYHLFKFLRKRDKQQKSDLHFLIFFLYHFDIQYKLSI